jgi:hypothetical protein
MRRLPENWQRTFLDTLLLAEEPGDCLAMRSLLFASTAAALTNFGSDPVLANMFDNEIRPCRPDADVPDA